MTEDKLDDYKRIYGGCSKHPVMQAITEFYQTHRHAVWTPDWVTSGYPYDPEALAEHELHFEYFTAFNAMVSALRVEYDRLLGPRIEVQAAQGTKLDSFIEEFDFDTDRAQDGVLKLSEYFEWDDSAFAKAALLYSRECHWDFAPGEAGIWLTYVILTGAVNECFSGNLVGFAILYDRDHDGKYESIGHLWTAEFARRKGVARQLLERAKRDFPIERIEGPSTDAGHALIEATWPEMIR